MKKTAFIALCLIVHLSIFTNFAWAEGEGRYELFQGKYSHYDGTQGVYADTQGIFLIDTVTGEVSVLMSSSDEKGRRVRYWEPLALDETKTPTGF
ncbi:MAG: hypothetical protein A3C36_05055 [Omnitrophica WOR_2 bacterium RIFCSPHIGHO2_02_FULL_52_10]|nr:MAG: hypothetical protein A3C36_05055 [Omnitrophica WOR_2 bacterium RIFCSPHIGHO2_02_FULL_52_10]